MKNAAAASNGLCLLAALACIQRASPAFAYDLHTKALVPIAERAKPAGAPMEFVKGGRLNFVVVADAKSEATRMSDKYIIKKKMMRAFLGIKIKEL